MTDEPTVAIATDENNLADCGCGENDLAWGAPADHNASEADHSLEEAREIGGTFTWENWEDPPDGLVADQLEKARRNGVRAFCASCYGTMSPTLATHELRDDLEGDARR